VHEELLPDASLVLEKCQECSDCVTKTLSSDPYDKPQSVVEEMEMTTIEKWRDMCLVLQNDLEESLVLAQECKRRADILFGGILTSWSKKEWLKDNYLPKLEANRDN
jgi:hypothetical protein